MLIVLAGNSAQAKTRYQVLAIHSYHKGFTWTDGIDGAIRKVFEAYPEIELTSEFLDSKRWPLEGIQHYFSSYLQAKFSRNLPDAIILSDNNAFTFMQKIYPHHFKGVPVIFCGLNNFQPDALIGFGGSVTGVLEKTDPRGTVNLIRKIQPDLKRLTVITGTSPTAQAIKRETEIVLDAFSNNLEIIWKDQLTSRALFRYLDTVSPKEAVLLISFNRDRDGVYYSYEQSGKLISARSAAPVYGLWDFYLNTGVVGGKMVCSEDQGENAAKLCLAIIKENRTPPIIDTSPNSLLIDYHAFAAHGLNEMNLPGNAKILNKPISFYEANKRLIGLVSTFILVLVTLVLILTVNIFKRRESEKKYKSLFEYSTDSIFLMDYGFKMLDCNNATLKLFEIESKEEFLTMDPVKLSPSIQMDGTLSADKADEMISLTRKNNFHRFEWRHKKINGQAFDANVLLSQIELGGRTVIQATVRDISKQKLAQETLIQSEKMMSVGGLAAGMAHEINNPLAGMIQSASVLANRLTNTQLPGNRSAAKDAGTTMETLQRYLEFRHIPGMIKAITDSGLRIASIVENMLSFARKGDSAFSTHNPAELLDKTLELAATDFNLKKQYDFRAITIEKQYDRQLPLIHCEGSKIQQVLLNILNNGAYAMSEDPKTKAPKFVLRLRHEIDLNMLRIEIEDNGPGMEKNVCKRIFEPFFTTKPVGVGTGLGLSVSYFIVTENHKGTLAVISEQGKGTNFIIRLPVDRKIKN